ncbi:MAG: hypothetical protein A2W05_06335 [Candidatus Schekmanbacteria bacterium RBG_16_38_10]|uniref:DUF3800 domain-containing protein n=1 Tax=Candidatus Schekmanbacteria bacterium RBG_16_38_10 TaxID=1817879 RepID=A0A1F7RVB7_9BACT|nr:MAG: hypothetical protein A2W05_06335 [Candidatus Schekmanbacteria bacterium RBG_16_38_10]
MWYLYLDESGDLGFDFVNKKPSKFFTISILAIKGQENNRLLIKAVKKTLRRKLNQKKSTVEEMKGSKTVLEIKKYFYTQVKDLKFALYALTLNKRRVYERLTKDKERVYNYISRLVLDKIPFEKAQEQVILILDKSKTQKQVRDFNQYVFRQLKGRLDPKVPLDIKHQDSQQYYGLQAVDLFSWGIFRKYEKKDSKWFEIFREKVAFEEQYL